MALDFLAGCAGGAAGVVVGHPLDTVKVRLQTQSPDNIKYRGTFHCLSTIARQESIAGLYKGISSPLCGVAAVNAVIFGVYGLLRPLVINSPGNDSLLAHFAAGSISGAVQSFIASPMELVKTRMQLDESISVKKPSSLDVLKGIYRNEGGLVKGVMKGWSITLAREIPGFGAYFATYEALTRYGQGTTFEMMMAGGMAGVASWVLCFPADVIKTRLQSDITGRYTGTVDCFRKTYKAEGYKAFTRGLTSTVIRAFPTNAATFTVVTWIMRLADEKQDDLQNSHQQLEHLLQEWDAARLQQRLFNYDTLYMSMTQPRRYDFMSLNSQCVVPQKNSGDYLNAFACSGQEASFEGAKSPAENLRLQSVGTTSNNADKRLREIIESKSLTKDHVADHNSGCVELLAHSHSNESPHLRNTHLQHQKQHPDTNNLQQSTEITSNTHTNPMSDGNTTENKQPNISHATTRTASTPTTSTTATTTTPAFPAELKAVFVGEEGKDDGCSKNSRSRSDDEEQASISSLLRSWMMNSEWTPLKFCKCYGDHCVCYV